MIKRFKRHKDYGFFDQDIRLTKLSELGDPLDRLRKGVDFELFRSFLEDKLSSGLKKGIGGRPPYDYVLLFKILILQRYYNLSDDQTEYQINDRMSFMRFLDLTIADDIPDSKTVWAFREKIIDLGLIEPIFELFLIELTKLGLVLNEGKIIDASFVEVPRQRNTKEQNEQIKNGEIPIDLTANPNVLAQKDFDASWTKKNNQTFFGYKNHVKVENLKKFIVSYFVTTASVHDSQAIDNLLDSTDMNQTLHADSAYTGEKQEVIFQKYEVKNQVHEKGYKNKPLTQEQKIANNVKSKTRVRVEHVFGFMENSMNQMYLQYIGIKRTTAAIGLMNLVYNMNRKVQLAM
jgi:transposase, IS5 family